MSYSGPDFEHPELAAFITALPAPDPELERTSADFRNEHARVAALRSQRDNATAALVDLANSLPAEIDAATVDRLLTKRARLQQIAGATADALIAAEYRCILANLHFLARLQQVAHAERDRAAAALAPIEAQAYAGQKALALQEREKRGGRLPEAEYNAAVVDERDSRARLHAQAMPIYSRLHAADLVARVCDVRALQEFGITTIGNPNTWEQDLRAHAARSRRPAPAPGMTQKYYADAAYPAGTPPQSGIRYP